MKKILSALIFLIIISLLISSPKPVSAATVPYPPTALTATTSITSTSSSQITLHWLAPSNNGGSSITGYKIERSIDGGISWPFSITLGNVITYSNAGLSATTTYTYRVSAINGMGTGSPSNTASATTTPANSSFPPVDQTFINAENQSSYVITSPQGCTDADADGICDNWETNTGLDVEYNNSTGHHFSYKWPCDPNAGYVLDTNNPNSYVDPLGTKVCPNPHHHDLYVEVDWMTTQAPNPGVLAAVVSAFVNSPTQNPLDNGKTGINLHIQYGQSATSGDMNFFFNLIKVKSAAPSTLPGFYVLKEKYFGTTSERSGADPNNPGVSVIDLLMAKRQVFHYAMFIHQQSEAGFTTSSGWAEILGNDLVVSLGSFYNGVGSVDDQEGSFMHELGHNMGLYHGGGYPPDIANPDNDNCKPNYLSIMSYTYQFASSFDPNRPLDFSNRQLNNIDESNPNEQAGVNSYKYPGVGGGERQIFFSGPTGLLSGYTGGSVDWNGNPNINSGYSQILNSLPSKSACQNTFTHILCGHDDWNNDNVACQGVVYPSGFDPTTSMTYTFQQSSNSATGNSTGTGLHLSNTVVIPDSGEFKSPCKITPLPHATLYYKAIVTNPYSSGVSTNNTVAITPCGETTEATLEQVSSSRALHITLINNTLFAFPYKVFSSDSALQTLASDVNNANLTQGNVWTTYYQLDILKNDSQKLIVDEDARKIIGQEIDNTKALYAIAGTVPEFGPVAVIILGISFVSIIIISKTRINLKF